MGEWTDKAKGRVKQAVGGATGDRELQAEGHVDETKGKAKGVVEDVKHGIKDALNPDRKAGVHPDDL